MAKNLFVIAILSVSLVACESAVEPTKDDQAKTEKKQEKKKEKEVIKIAVEANRVLRMDLDGMVCSMGCGGSIRKGLNATGAVADCDFDFENDIFYTSRYSFLILFFNYNIDIVLFKSVIGCNDSGIVS